jgi:hypothetical protein
MKRRPLESVAAPRSRTRLSLDREVLRRLDDDRLRGAAGGNSNGSGDIAAPAFDCSKGSSIVPMPAP